MKDKIIILFSVVAAFLFIITLFLIYANGQQKAINVPTPHPTPFLTTCQLNDKNYAVGESFKSADGCNTCSCTADFQIACTEMACITSTPAPSIKATPTKTATVSAIPQGWKLMCIFGRGLSACRGQSGNHHRTPTKIPFSLPFVIFGIS